MRILLVTKLGFNPQVLRWVRCLRTEGTDVACIHIGTPHGDTGGLDSNEGLSLHYLFDEGVSKPQRRLLRLFRRYRTILQYERPDIIWALCFSVVLLPLIWAKSICRIPLVVTACGSDINIQARNIKNRLVFRHLIRHSELITTTACTMMDKLQAIVRVPRAKRLVHYWGIDLDAFSPMTVGERTRARQHYGIHNDDVVIFMGRIYRPIAYYSEAIDALAQLAASPASHQFRAVFVNWASDPGVVSKVTSKVRSLGLEERCIFIDRQLSASELREVYGMSDIALNLLWADQLGAMIFESLAMGCILVTTDLPQYLMLPGQGLQLFYVRREKILPDLLTRLEFLMENLEVVRRAVVDGNSRIVARDYDFAREVAVFAEVLGSLAASHHTLSARARTAEAQK